MLTYKVCYVFNTFSFFALLTSFLGKFWNTLSLYLPHLIIMLDPEISIIREIELFAAISEKSTKLSLQVIMITVQNSIRHVS